MQSSSVDITSDEFEAIKSSMCPPENPFLCTTKTDSMGLCRKDPKDCGDRHLKTDSDESDKSAKTKKTESNQFGYHTNNITDYCGSYNPEYMIEYDGGDSLPKSFKVLTWNIWGMNKRREHGDKFMLLSELMMLRMEEVVKQLVKEDPDVVMIQEMSFDALGMIKGFMRKYNLSDKYTGYGHNFSRFSPDKMEAGIGRDLENYVFSKYTPSKIKQFSLAGNLGYTTAITCVCFDDVCIVGTYLQAGSKNSPGQEEIWYHYSRCRLEQLKAINEIINEECADQTVILCGDFNMDLDGSKKEWPEVRGVKNMGVVDTWRAVYPDTKQHPGFTEDTDINHMRWNMKFMEKRYRYDGILLKNSKTKLIVTDSKMIGLESIPMADDMYREFLRVLSNKNSKHSPRSQTYHPSDHFGVMTTFSRSK
ncbi:hypothetical protein YASMINEVIRUS_1230 [Yasminevirus sp. GU-2018]|uniref:Endonuclease/exonuclease/phosphatase domain-containing protein n=1 Tax=Yasminevirus sp. GU-2018 TaxID=2420051 RepID=A0A5K0U9K7_9VIRU|nr:hypothetical protein YASMINEVIRUS_1230 [Yasminevirus sp. GU-2018]